MTIRSASVSAANRRISSAARIEGGPETAQTRLGLPDPVLGKIAELRVDGGRPRLRAGIGHDVQHGQAGVHATGKTDGHTQYIARGVREIHTGDDAENARAVGAGSIGLSSPRRHVSSVSHLKVSALVAARSVPDREHTVGQWTWRRHST
jgi:hypothetical protein